MQVAALQFKPEFGQIDKNIDQIEDLTRSLNDIDLLVLPELASTGYHFTNRKEALQHSESISNSRFVDFLIALAREKDMLVVAGINEKETNKLFNSSVMVGPDGLVGTYRKLHLFRNEKQIFEPGNLGLPLFDTPFGKIGMLICFDWMFPEAWRALALKGANLIAHPANLVLPYCQSVTPSYCLTNRIFSITANRIGKERDLNFTGQSLICDCKGNELKRGSKNETELLQASIKLELSNDKSITPENDAFQDRRQDVYGNLNCQ
jgi:predicted amidohydrolase